MEKLPLCPICKRRLDDATLDDATLARHKPFCSQRCADVDLSRWLNGAYAVPAVEADEGPDGEGEPGEA